MNLLQVCDNTHTRKKYHAKKWLMEENKKILIKNN